MRPTPIGIEDVLLFVLGEYSVDQKADNTEFEFKLNDCVGLDKLWNSSEPQLFDL